ncbi:MAG TPA: hypothetical protein VL495_09885 [Edaphobacter sp.]|nr:hypothetical protein [Edaphobacter sp.]
MYRILLPLIFLIGACTAEAQDGFIKTFAAQWEARATRTQAAQPKWSVPMFSPFPMVAQVFRTDFTSQKTPTGTNWYYGHGKGFNLIPYDKIQIDVFVPGYVSHGESGQDGFGDMSLVGKYRFLSRTEGHGNYILTGGLGWVIPTGSYKNGGPSSVLNPTLLGGKGFGKLALMSSIGGGLPTSQVSTTGRTVHWNSVAQYKIGRYFAPELEVNSTSYFGGTRDGKTQVFLSPGIIVGKLPIRSVETSRLGITVGAGFQTAVTSFHTYNYAFSTSLRFVF